MKKVGWLLIILSATLPLTAGEPLWPWLFRAFSKDAAETTLSKTVGETALQQGIRKQLTAQEVSRLLKQCVNCSFEQAHQIQRTTSPEERPPMGVPMRKVRKPQELISPGYYAENSFITTPKQAGQYFAIRSNRAYMQEIERMKKFLSELDSRLPDMVRIANELPQPDDIDSWLVKRIPAETKNLFIGEVHNKRSEIRAQVASFLTALRRRYLSREIILFTEFLPENYVWGSQQYSRSELEEFFPQFFPVWNVATANEIKVVGLEKNSIINDQCTAQYIFSTGKKRRGSAWVSLEGMRLRNESWNKMLAQYRQQHPNALFVIYSGAAHSFYNHPFALPEGGPNKENFVVAFYPDSMTMLSNEGTQYISHRTGPLENLTKDVDFPQKVLYWDDPELIRLSGFDVRVKVHALFE